MRLARGVRAGKCGCQLERELAEFSTAAQRREIEATLDRYPDHVTQELRNFLDRQATAAF